MNKIYRILLAALLGALLCVGAVSVFDRDATVSVSENRKLAQRPALSLRALADGSFTRDFESYYSDAFPGREGLLAANRLLNHFYYFSGSAEQSVLVLEQKGGAEQGGEALHRVEETLSGSTDAEAQQPPEPPAQAEPEQTPSGPEPAGPEQPQEPVQPEEETPPEEAAPEISEPEESEASYAGSVVVVGDRAMEIPTATDSVIERYAAAVGSLSAALGGEVRTISVVVPNGGEFYSPESLHTGLHSQKAMIEHCYESMPEQILTVDAYSQLRAHTDEYIYFRTDHHWTQLGAYYAYRAFCQTAGFTPVELDEFQTGRYDGFLGSMYTYTSGYPQSQTLKDNPDYLDYYLPVVETHARYYADASLQDGVPVSVVYTKLSDTVSNKYLCFIGGDTPVCVIETAAEGGVCMVLKESYGNAFVPFLTSHYSKIIVVDPREFNREGKPSLELAPFAQAQGVDDLIVINYPYMINNTAYIRWLERLAGTAAE